MNRIVLLREALQLLASPACDQLNHLRQMDVPNGIDELALCYNDIAAAAEDMRNHRELDPIQCDAVKRLDRVLSSMSGQRLEHLWTADALISAHEWDEVRRLANETLNLLRDRRSEL